MSQAADTVMTQIVRETHPDISDADLPEAISQIDMSDPRIGARIFGTAFDVSSESSNTFHCRGMGRVGDGILKTTPGFQKKGASSSSQVAQLSSQLQQTTSQLQRMAEENARMRQYQREMAEWNQAVLDVQTQNNAIQVQWMQDFSMALAQGLPAPPVPTPIRAPERPTPPDVRQQQQQDGEDPQQQQGDGQDPQQGDGDDMVDLGLDDD